MDYFGVYKDLLRIASRAMIQLVMTRNSAKAMWFVDECARFREDIRCRRLVTPLQVHCAVAETGTFFQR